MHDPASRMVGRSSYHDERSSQTERLESLLPRRGRGLTLVTVQMQ